MSSRIASPYLHLVPPPPARFDSMHCARCSSGDMRSSLSFTGITSNLHIQSIWTFGTHVQLFDHYYVSPIYTSIPLRSINSLQRARIPNATAVSMRIRGDDICGFYAPPATTFHALLSCSEFLLVLHTQPHTHASPHVNTRSGPVCVFCLLCRHAVDYRYFVVYLRFSCYVCLYVILDTYRDQ